MGVSDYILTFVGGVFGAFFWMGILWAVFRDRPDADALAFKAMAILLLASFLFGLAFPQNALDGDRALVVAIGYVLVMGWFWKSRGLQVFGKSQRVAERR